MSLAWFRCRGRLLALVAVFLFGTFFCLTRYADMASLRQGSLLALLSAAPAVIGSDPKLKWYPPSENKVNCLGCAIDGEGTYGFIFDSSDTPDEKYGTYNWCNMPHARKREYEKPSKEYQLQYVEVVSITISLCMTYQLAYSGPDPKTSQANSIRKQRFSR
jgi:acid phosphatase